MRVTAEKKEQTREAIVASARKLFLDKGFEQTTTRDIASSAGIAAGTLFNYFPSKEGLALTMMADALELGSSDFEGRRRGDESLDELLFGLTVAGLRRLAPYRSFVGEAADSGLSPFTRGGVSEEAERIRLSLLETVQSLIAMRSASAVSFLTMHLFWTLWLGVLAYWVGDESEHQEETLAVVDQATKLFVGSLLPGACRAGGDLGSDSLDESAMTGPR
jgi:AcrR family transcriptional regulator